MKYTQTVTQPINQIPLGKNIPVFKSLKLGIGKTMPFFINSTLKSKSKIFYKLQEYDPENSDKPQDIEEINEPTIDINENDQHIHYNTIAKNKQRIIYSCQHNVDDIDDRGVIEIPADNDTVIYQDEDGQYYEIPTSDLIEYDGDDGEITYHGKALKKIPFGKMHHIKDKPNYYLNMILVKNMMQRVHGQA